MKIAYVVSLFPKISETFILREMVALRRQGVEIVVVSLKRRREPIEHPAAAAFLPVTYYAGAPLGAAAAFLKRLFTRPAALLSVMGRIFFSHLSRPASLVKALPLAAVSAEIADLLRSRGVDRVHAHWATYPALAAWAIRRLEGIPFSITAHAHDIFLPNPMLQERVEESDFTVTISEFNRKWMEERCGGAAGSKITVLHCGVPLDDYASRPAPPKSPPRVVSIGRLVDYKGFPTLLRAVAALRAKGVDLRCDIVGEGPERGRLAALLRDLGLEEWVTMHGARTEESTRGILAAGAVCALACEVGRDGQMDGIPVVLMEALALGVPSVATRLSGIPELIEDGVTGLLVEPRDPAALAKAIERLLDDPELAARLAREGRRRVESDFDVSRNTARLAGLFAAAPAPPPAGRR